MKIFYATHDGQTKRIAERIAQGLEDAGVPACAIDIAKDFPDPSLLTEAAILAAAVRYGRHLPVADRFLALYASLPEPRPPLVLASVSLTARKPGRDGPDDNPYLRRWLKKRNLAPELVTAFAGRLDYPRYDWLDRCIIRLIMKMTGGPTDPGVQIEFTDWDKVDAFARAIAARFASTPVSEEAPFVTH